MPNTSSRQKSIYDVIKAMKLVFLAPGISVFNSLGFIHSFKANQNHHVKTTAIKEDDIVNKFLFPNR